MIIRIIILFSLISTYLKKKYHVVLSKEVERFVKNHRLFPARIFWVSKLEQQIARLGGQWLDVLFALQRAKIGARIRSDRRLVHKIAGMNLKAEKKLINKRATLTKELFGSPIVHLRILPLSN